MSRLLNRFGQRLCTLRALCIDYPVSRSGTRFEALLPTAALSALDPSRLRYFVVQDDAGNRYPAIIDQVSTVDDADSAIQGVVVTHG